jgi:hypothetical protein
MPTGDAQHLSSVRTASPRSGRHLHPAKEDFMYRVVFTKPNNVIVTGEQYLQCENKSAVRAFMQQAREYPGSYSIVRIEKREKRLGQWMTVPSSGFFKGKR